jgi:hypothetical protein
MTRLRPPDFAAAGRHGWIPAHHANGVTSGMTEYFSREFDLLSVSVTLCEAAFAALLEPFLPPIFRLTLRNPAAQPPGGCTAVNQYSLLLKELRFL